VYWKDKAAELPVVRDRMKEQEPTHNLRDVTRRF
jgi:hypothetical protein